MGVRVAAGGFSASQMWEQVRVTCVSTLLKKGIRQCQSDTTGFFIIPENNVKIVDFLNDNGMKI